jgi:hypothetical protein
MSYEEKQTSDIEKLMETIESALKIAWYKGYMARQDEEIKDLEENLEEANELSKM